MSKNKLKTNTLTEYDLTFKLDLIGQHNKGGPE